MSFYNNISENTNKFLKNLSKEKIVYKHLPAIGSASYLLLSTEFMTPNLFSKYSLTK
jgi:hypothetical protein